VSLPTGHYSAMPVPNRCQFYQHLTSKQLALVHLSITKFILQNLGNFLKQSSGNKCKKCGLYLVSVENLPRHG
jgi:hypothetical protein